MLKISAVYLKNWWIPSFIYLCISYLVSPFLIFFWKMLGFTNKHFTCFYFVILGPTGNSGMFFYDQRSTCTLPTKFVGSVAQIISSIKKFDIAAKNRKKSRLDKCIYVLVLTAAPLFFKTRIGISLLPILGSFEENLHPLYEWGLMSVRLWNFKDGGS